SGASGKGRGPARCSEGPRPNVVRCRGTRSARNQRGARGGRDVRVARKLEDCPLLRDLRPIAVVGRIEGVAVTHRKRTLSQPNVCSGNRIVGRCVEGDKNGWGGQPVRW